MTKPFTILVGDRNPHVRELLKRELGDMGCVIVCTKTAREVMETAMGRDDLDLMIFDPDFPDAEENQIVNQLCMRVPATPMIVLTYLSEYKTPSASWHDIQVIEKGEGSLKKIKGILQSLMAEVPLAENHQAPEPTL